MKFKRLYWGKENKVREENNERLLVSSGGSFRTPAGLLQLWVFSVDIRTKKSFTCMQGQFLCSPYE